MDRRGLGRRDPNARGGGVKRQRPAAPKIVIMKTSSMAMDWRILCTLALSPFRTPAVRPKRFQRCDREDRSNGQKLAQEHTAIVSLEQRHWRLDLDNGQNRAASEQKRDDDRYASREPVQYVRSSRVVERDQQRQQGARPGRDPDRVQENAGRIRDCGGAALAWPLALRASPTPSRAVMARTSFTAPPIANDPRASAIAPPATMSVVAKLLARPACQIAR